MLVERLLPIVNKNEVSFSLLPRRNNVDFFMIFLRIFNEEMKLGALVQCLNGQNRHLYYLLGGLHKWINIRYLEY